VICHYFYKVNAGHTRIFREIAGEWIQWGPDIDGVNEGDGLGISLKLNAQGDQIAIGAFGSDDNGINSGQVRVYDLFGILNVNYLLLSERIRIYPNPVSSKLQIRTSEGISLLKATVYSVLGEELFFTLEETVNFSNLSAGIYFVEVVTNHGIITKKIIKQ